MKTQGKQRIFDNSTILSQIKVMWGTFPDQFPSVAQGNQSGSVEPQTTRTWEKQVTNTNGQTPVKPNNIAPVNDPHILPQFFAV